METKFLIKDTGGKAMKGKLTLLNDEGNEDDAYTDSQISSSISSGDDDSDTSKPNDKFVSQFGGSVVSHFSETRSSE